MDVKYYGDVDGMDEHGGDTTVVCEDRCLGLPDQRRMKMDPRWASSPSISLPEVRFLRLSGVSVCHHSDPITRRKTI